MLYMGEIKHHSDRLAPVTADRAYLNRVVENAVAQTERVCTLVKQFAASHKDNLSAPFRPDEAEKGGVTLQLARTGGGSELSVPTGQKRLTKREREVLRLISEGFSNKQGALRMQISPRTFESHRAEAMRKLGARNTADLVRAALLYAID